VEQQQDVVDYLPMTASSSPSRATAATAAATTNTAAMGGEQHTRESIARTPQPQPPLTPLFNLHEYFQPVFDELDKLNKILDSHIEEEKMINPKRKRNDDNISIGRKSWTELDICVFAVPYERAKIWTLCHACLEQHAQEVRERSHAASAGCDPTQELFVRYYVWVEKE
jgi:hypothetical protein